MAESGARYSSNLAHGQARVHYGNNYIEHQNITNVASNSERSTAGGQLLDFVEALKFGFMDFRLDSIDPPHADTCTWLFQRPEYIRWRDPTHRETNCNLLWIKGRAGSGKSTIMKCTYEYIKTHHPSDTVISFFFNARGHLLEKSVEGMYRSILAQAIESFPALRSVFPSRAPPDFVKQGWPVPLLRNYWRKAFSSLRESRHSITLLIDALDECSEDEIREALEHFQDFGEQAHARDWHLYICLASRYYPKISVQECEEIFLDEQEEQMCDISKYVKNKLKLRSGALNQEIGAQVCRRSSQIFLWVVLVVRRLNERADRGCTRSRLIDVLNDVPEKLEGLLAYILADPDDTLILTIEWVLLTREELRVETLYTAIRCTTEKVHESDVERESIEQDVMESFILNASRGLVEFVASSPWHSHPRAQFIHEFVREYMINNGLAQMCNRKRETALAGSHAHLAMGCQAYLSLDSEKLSTNYHSKIRKLSFLYYAANEVFHHVECAYMGGGIGADFLDAFPWRMWITRMSGDTDENLVDNPTTFVYLAFRYGCNLLAGALLQRYAEVRFPLGFEKGPALPIAITSCQRDSKIELNAYCGGEFGYLITAACQYGNAEAVLLLLENGANPNPPHSEPLMIAVHSNNAKKARVLLQYGAASGTVLEKRMKYVQRAMIIGSAEMLQLHLELGAAVNIRIDQELPLLSYATRNGRMNQHGLVEVLLRFGAVPTCHPDGFGVRNDSISKAARYSKPETLQLLLNTQSKPPQIMYSRLLFMAVKSLNVGVVPLLLSKGGDVNSRDRFGQTPLYALTPQYDPWTRSLHKEHGSADPRVCIAQMLLEAGANVDDVGGKYDTALIAASAEERIGLVKLLLERGANMQYRSTQHGTALDVARAKNHADVVRLLEDWTSSTPLQADPDEVKPS